MRMLNFFQFSAKCENCRHSVISLADPHEIERSKAVPNWDVDIDVEHGNIRQHDTVCRVKGCNCDDPVPVEVGR